MVDAADRCNIFDFSVDRLCLYYVRQAGVASFPVGTRYQLGNRSPGLVLVHGGIQVLPVAVGRAGTLADAMGAAIAKNQKQFVKYPGDSWRRYSEF